MGGPLGEEPPGGGCGHATCALRELRRGRGSRLRRATAAASSRGRAGRGLTCPRSASPPKRSSLQLHCEASPAGARRGPSPARPERGVAIPSRPWTSAAPLFSGNGARPARAWWPGRRRLSDLGTAAGLSGSRLPVVRALRRLRASGGPGVHAPSGTRRSPGSAAFALQLLEGRELAVERGEVGRGRVEQLLEARR